MDNRDWKALAAAIGLELKGPELDRLLQAVAKLDETFRPLLAELTSDIEPVVVFRPGEIEA